MESDSISATLIFRVHVSIMSMRTNGPQMSMGTYQHAELCQLTYLSQGCAGRPVVKGLVIKRACLYESVIKK